MKMKLGPVSVNVESIDNILTMAKIIPILLHHRITIYCYLFASLNLTLESYIVDASLLINFEKFYSLLTSSHLMKTK